MISESARDYQQLEVPFSHENVMTCHAGLFGDEVHMRRPNQHVNQSITCALLKHVKVERT